MNPITILPTATFRPFLQAPVEISLFGRNFGQTDWSISGLREQTDLYSCENRSVRVYWWLNEIAGNTGLPIPRTVFAPVPSEFNAEVIRSHLLLKQPMTYRHQTAHDPQDYQNVVLGRGAFADGCDVPCGTAFWISSGDCPTIIAWGEKKRVLVCTHAGRDCLVDRKRLRTGKRSRTHESVVDAVMEFMRLSGETHKSVVVYLTCGIGPRHFAHPVQNGDGNPEHVLLVKWACSLDRRCLWGDPTDGLLNLPEIITRQFEEYGIGRDRIGFDGRDTYADRVGDEHLWWSHERGRSPEEKAKRNGVLVVRTDN